MTRELIEEILREIGLERLEPGSGSDEAKKAS